MSLRLWLRASHDHQRYRKGPAKVEGRNFDIRKNLLEYDDVANDQRKVVYAQRDSLLATDDASKTIADFRAEVMNTNINHFVPHESLEEQWDIKGLEHVGKGKLPDQFEFSEANHGIIEALNIQKMYSGNIVIHPTF